MKAWPRVAGVLAATAFVATAWGQAGVQRCESADGIVTYSNTPCPTGTAAVRTIHPEPPVNAEDRKAAGERTRNAIAAARQAETEQARQEARTRRETDARSKLEARTRERCQLAQRNLERARKTREDLGRQAATVEKMHKADAEISRRESQAANDCPR